MNRKTLYFLHRWIFIFLGAFMVAWLLSGVLMEMPMTRWFGTITWYSPQAVDYRSATLSPAAAIGRLETGGTGPVEVTGISLTRIEDRLLYVITSRNGQRRMIDARDGSEFVVDAEFAVMLVRRTFGIEAPVDEIVALDAYSLRYPWGGLPAWRVSFRDGDKESYTVSSSDLHIKRSTGLPLAVEAVISLHTLAPLQWWTGSEDARKSVLVVTGLIALAGSLIGVWLTLPRRRRPG